MRALVLDDSKAIRMVLRSLLEGWGWEVDEAVTGPEALQRFDAAPPDLALVDWNLDGPSGLEFVRAVRNRPDGSAVKLVMVTSQNHKEDVERALEAGVDEYIMKPFTRDILGDKLRLLGLEGR